VWTAGALTNLLNPKVAVIHTSLLPSLVSRTGASTCGPLLAPGSRSVGRDGYAHPEALEVVWGRIVALVARDGAVTLADLRDDLGTSRKFAQALLELFDSAKVALRLSDDRRVRRAGEHRLLTV
jgi:Elongation factor SelB, winged helix